MTKLQMFARSIDNQMLVVLKAGEERKELKGEGSLDDAICAGVEALKAESSIKCVTHEMPEVATMRKASALARSKGCTISFSLC